MVAILSVVLISRNQEWNIARLIESVLSEPNIPSDTEVLLVDSASSDQTTEIASQYPISIIKLASNQRLTPAAGRYIGYKNTNGEFILFLDGDMEFCSGWLKAALELIKCKPEVAVICGQVIDRPIDEKRSSKDQVIKPDTEITYTDVLHGGGAACYRRSVLDQVGPFNPYLYADEEPELCLRVRHAGYRVQRLERPIVFHYSNPFDSISTLFDKRKRNFFLGYGQNIRNFLGTPFLWPYLEERGSATLPAMAIIMSFLLVLLLSLYKHWLWLAIWLITMIVTWLGIAIWRRNFRRTSFSIVGRFLQLEGMVRGFFLQPLTPLKNTIKYDMIKHVRNPLCKEERSTCQSTIYPQPDISSINHLCQS